ncbi:uncharacterized protein LOC134804964 [Cydia splendana]|uniref:uncharacterized protein LOC134804964 n=1 Tax=Cydia splendana TaxID=1100963 RepID=UPI0028F493BD
MASEAGSRKELIPREERIELDKDGGYVNSRGEGLSHRYHDGVPGDKGKGKDDGLTGSALGSRTEPTARGQDMTYRRSRSRYRSSDYDSEEEYRRRRKRRTRRRRSYSSGSSGRSPVLPAKRTRGDRSKGSDPNIMLDKFLNILDNFKRSDKPKLTFNTNVVPEFDPSSKEQTILTWLTKVKECAQIYGWEDKEIIHYSLPKPTGLAKTWYQGLSTLLFTWTEWKQKLIESFPYREDYAELLTEMLAKKVKYGESFEHYYYAKVNLLNRCKIYNKHAVDCLLNGIEDRTVKVSAQAAQFKEPEEVLKYFRTIKVGQHRDNNNATSLKKYNNNNERKPAITNSRLSETSKAGSSN